MISGNDERIAIVFETQAKMDGIRQTELGLSRVGRMASDVMRQGQQGAMAQAAAQALVKNAFEADIAALSQYGRTIDVTNRQSVAAFKESIAAQRQLMVDAKATTQQFQALDAVMVQVAQRSKATRGAGVIVDPRTGAEYDKLSPKIRTAANAASTMAFAATSAQMGLGGAAIAAGTMATSLATLTTSARIAASATGIGAIVTVGLTAVTVLQSLKKEAFAASDSLKRIISEVPDADVGIGYARAQKAKRDAMQAILDAPSWEGRKTFEKRDARERELEAAIENEALWHTRMQEARRNIAKEEASEAESNAERAREQRTRDAREAIDIERDLGFEIQKLMLERTGQTEAIRNLEADRDFQRREREINALKISEHRKTAIIKLAYQARLDSQSEFAREMKDRVDRQMRDESHEMVMAILRSQGKERLAREAEVERAFEVRMQEIDRMEAAEEVKEARRATAKRKRDAEMLSIEQDAAKKREAVALNAVQAISRGTESVAKTLKRLALEPIITELEGIAARELVRAAASWMNPFAALKHVATAGFAVATARKLSQAAGGGGGSGSAGGGGAGSGSAGGGATFEPRGSAGGGATHVVVNLITKDPYGSESMKQVMYYLQRGGMLKVGAQVPPTIGAKAAIREDITYSSI